MSNDSIITQCPHCKSQFRVTQGQLKIANRQVRCGHCLNVFSATDNEEKPSRSTTRSHLKKSHTAQNHAGDRDKELTHRPASQYTKPDSQAYLSQDSTSYPPQKNQASSSSIEPTQPEQPFNTRTVEIKTAAEPDSLSQP